MKKLIALSSFILLFISFQLSAEKPPIKFGKVSLEEVQMTSYEADTSAPAVILCDYGEFRSTTFQFTRVLRIKILKKEGYEWANKKFKTREKTSVHGYTFNLVDGEIEKTKLKSESIFKENVTDDVYRLRVSMPNVKVGSVIDLEFIHGGIPWEWYFQTTIPVVRSELIIEPTAYITFRTNFSGFEPLSLSSSTHWLGENMPAFKPEPYMNSTENYLTKIDFDVLEISFPGYFYESYTTSWEDLSDYLNDHSFFGEALRNSGYMNSLAKEIKLMNLTNKEDLLLAAYEKIKDFNWNGNERLYTSHTSINVAYKERTGNSAEINLALVQLLRKLDFTVTPVVMSTRDNGILSLVNPSLQKLNYVIAKVELGDKTYLIDATEKNGTYDILPFRCLNWFGYEVDEKLSEKVDLTANKKECEQIQISFDLTEDNSLKGKINCVRKDYAALNFRNSYESFNSLDEYIDEFSENNPGIRVQECTIDNLDSLHLPIKDSYEVIIKNQVERIGDEFFLYPVVFNRLEENPFTLETRQYPIDYGHCYENTVLATINIPDNYSIVSTPNPLILKLPDNSANFSYQVSVMNNSIHLMYKFTINKVVFVEDEYPNLKELYNQIVQKHAEPVILKKI
ncbi:MAG: DUF3857 domain-containing protein [Bacteroidales bacterium]|nr:DUF3857 domain-containing protein [Bacteroidales bacterium]MCF8402885.1 DUF3857 domain-containing protein [Bacteroidales bacterium]